MRPPEPAHAQLLADPFARWVAVDIGGVAAVASAASPAPVVELVEAWASVPTFVADEISEAVDLLPYPRTIRVTTDCTWTMEAA